MSDSYNRKKYGKGISFGGIHGMKGTAEALPMNCKTPCPYGRSRAFCFPCYAQIMHDMKISKGDNN